MITMIFTISIPTIHLIGIVLFFVSEANRSKTTLHRVTTESTTPKRKLYQMVSNYDDVGHIFIAGEK